MTNRIRILFLMLIAFIASGCAPHEYTYIKCKPEAMTGCLMLSVAGTNGFENSMQEAAKPFKLNFNKIKNLGGPLSAIYLIKQGEKDEEVINELGSPMQSLCKDDSKRNCVWEYRFCTIYFINKKVKDLIFKDEKFDGYLISHN